VLTDDPRLGVPLPSSHCKGMRFGLPQPIYQHSIDGLRLLYCRVGLERRDLRSVQPLVRQMGASKGEEGPLRHISIVTQRRKKHMPKGKALLGLASVVN